MLMLWDSSCTTYVYIDLQYIYIYPKHQSFHVDRYTVPVLLLMEEILHQLRLVAFHLQGFIYPRWLFGISSITSTTPPNCGCSMVFLIIYFFVGGTPSESQKFVAFSRNYTIDEGIGHGSLASLETKLKRGTSSNFFVSIWTIIKMTVFSRQCCVRTS